MASQHRLNWAGPQILERARRGAVDGLTAADLIIEGAAKQELYPGHGKLTGRLQRAIAGEPGRMESPSRAAGRVAVRGVRYARRIHDRYRYLTEGARKSRDAARRAVVDRIAAAIQGA